MTDEIKRHFGMRPLEGEGGLYYQSYVSDETFAEGALPGREGPHPYGSAILYLLEGEGYSRMHRLASDEIFHFYLGEPCEMLLLYPDGRGETVKLGPDILNGEQLQVLVPRGVWQGTRLAPGSAWALLGTTMAPGYTDRDYEDGDFAELSKRYPDYVDQLREYAGEVAN